MKMERLVKSAQFVGQVVGLVMGSKFTIPAAKELEKHPHLSSGV